MTTNNPQHHSSDPEKAPMNGATKAVVIAAVIGAVGAITAASVAGVFGLIDNKPPPAALTPPPSSITPDSIATISSPTSSNAACDAHLAITSPVNGQQVVGSAGVEVTGTACGLANEYGWVFDQDGEDHYYYDVYANTPAPALSGNGSWSVLDQPIGSPGDRGVTYSLTLVLASAACNQALLAMPPVDGDYKVLTFPPGCQVVQTVNVVVTYPE